VLSASGTTYGFNNRRPNTQASNNFTSQNDLAQNSNYINQNTEYNNNFNTNSNNPDNNNNNNNYSQVYQTNHQPNHQPQLSNAQQPNSIQNQESQSFSTEAHPEWPFLSFHNSESSSIEVNIRVKNFDESFPFFEPHILKTIEVNHIEQSADTDNKESIMAVPIAISHPNHDNITHSTTIDICYTLPNVPPSTSTFRNRYAILNNNSEFSFISPDVICDTVLLALEENISTHRYISAQDINGNNINIQCFALTLPIRVEDWSANLEFLVSLRFRHPPIWLGRNFSDVFNARHSPRLSSASINTTVATEMAIVDTHATVSISLQELDRITSTSTSLLKIKGTIVLFNEFKTNVSILIDGGSTHSFVSPKILNTAHLTHLVTPDTPTKQRRNFCITSATQDVTSSCTVTIAEIEFQGWKGRYQFTISDKITRNDVVIGRDFLKHFSAIVDHGSDSLQLENKIIKFSDFNNFNHSGAVNKIVSFSDDIAVITTAADNSDDDDNDDNSINNDEDLPSAHKAIVSQSNVGGTSNLVQFSNEEQIQQKDFVYVNPTVAKNIKSKLPDCYATTETSIPALSQRLVELEYVKNSNFDGLQFFEPSYPMPRGCLVARSVNFSNTQTFCNVINTLTVPVTIEANRLMGSLVKATLAESNDDDEISHRQSRVEQAAHLVSIFKTTVEETSRPINVDTVQWTNICSIPVGEKLHPNQIQSLRVVLLKNYESFQWDANSISRTNLVEHSIDTGAHAPIRTKQYPLPTVAMDQIRAQAAQMLKDGTIRHSHSSWQSPILLIKQVQADATIKYRFCVDLRKVNAITARDSYNLPRISETVDKLNGMVFFSNGDIDRAFWQVGVVEKDKCKHAFNVDGTLYEGNVMSFGSMNAPATFQRLMDTILKGLTWKQCLAYIDDILIFSRTFELHLKHIDEVLSRIANAKLKLKPSKCSFGNNEVEYLGFRISDQGIQPSKKKVERLLAVKPPKTPALLNSYLCSINFYRQDIPHFGHITAELHDMANSKSRFLTWSDEALRQFSKLQNAFATAPILAFPDFDKPFFIQGDASSKAIGGACLQKHTKPPPPPPPENFIFRPNCFFGRKLTKTERRWSATERELLALVYGYTICYHLVFGRRIVFLTDHKPLATLDKLKMPFGRLGQLLFKLEGVDYSIVYIEGSKNYLPDFLSRAHFENPITSISGSILVQSALNWQTEQAKDEEILRVIACIRRAEPETTWKEIQNGSRWFRERAELFVLNNILYHSKTRLVVPNQLKEQIMTLHHDSPFSGHRGPETTFKSVSHRYYWNFMLSEIKNYCRSCRQCQKYNYAVLHNKAPMKSIEVVRRNQIWVIDYMGPLKTSRYGNKYIILACDAQDKWLEGCATPTFDAPTTATFTFNNIICRYGMVEKILTDQGVSFENALFKELCRLIGTDKLHSSTYHAMGHGQIERVNRVVKPNLAKYVNDEEDDWDLFVQMAISSYNHSYHESIGMSPFEARFGYKPTLVADVIMNNKAAGTQLNNFSNGMVKFAEHINNVLNDNKAEAQKRQKFYYDRVLHANAFYKIGDKVKITNFRVRPGHSKAFEPKFLGPYTIVQRQNEFNYLLSAPNVKNELVHFNRMSHYNERETNDCVVPKLINDSNILKSKPHTSERITVEHTTIAKRNLFVISSEVARARTRRSKRNVVNCAAVLTHSNATALANVARDQRAINRNANTSNTEEFVEENQDITTVPPVHIAATINELPTTSINHTTQSSVRPNSPTNSEISDTLHHNDENVYNYVRENLSTYNDVARVDSLQSDDEFTSFEEANLTMVRQVIPTETIPLNVNGKEQIYCPHCLPIKKLVEITYGLRSHIRFAHPQVMVQTNLISTPRQERQRTTTSNVTHGQTSPRGEGL
jgi:hypothetical protein